MHSVPESGTVESPAMTSSFTFPLSLSYRGNRDGIVGIVTKLRAVRVLFPIGPRKFALLRNNRTSSGANLISDSMCTGRSLAWGKAAGT